jgi:hypothetical protein
MRPSVESVHFRGFRGFRGLFLFCRDSGDGDVPHCLNPPLGAALTLSSCKGYSPTALKA